MKLKNIFNMLMFWGAVSGFLSYFLVEITESTGVTFIPGVIFGIMLMLFYKKNLLLSAAIIIFSTSGYMIAVGIVSYFLVKSFMIPIVKIHHIFAAGAAGALLLSLGLCILHKSYSIKKVVMISIMGGLLSIPFYFATQGDIDRNMMPWNLLLLYLIWQAGIAGLIYILYPHEARKK